MKPNMVPMQNSGGGILSDKFTIHSICICHKLLQRETTTKTAAATTTTTTTQKDNWWWWLQSVSTTATEELAHKLNCIEGKDEVHMLNQVPHYEIVSIP
jgi:hypothetical protein